ncbi:MAG: hypothetical protein H0V11_08620 [Actinobacteria bacterium]|nr:hypothetical protein [Actinomycetota bacterium]
MGKRPLFREVNERIRALNTSFGIRQGTYVVLCECDEAGCREQLEISAKLHAEVCARDDCFLVSAIHEDLHGERVVDRGETYLIVEATGLAA